VGGYQLDQEYNNKLIMSMLLDDFKSTKKDLKRIYTVIDDEFNEIDEENNFSKS
jgi:hypothetical protein